MPKRKTKKSQPSETDATFLLKIFLYFLLGSLWVRFDVSGTSGLQTIGVPVGLIMGLYFAHHEHFQIDRKLEYVILLISALLSYIAPIGFVLII
jgi:hypothetical protein